MMKKNHNHTSNNKYYAKNGLSQTHRGYESANYDSYDYDTDDFDTDIDSLANDANIDEQSRLQADAAKNDDRKTAIPTVTTTKITEITVIGSDTIDTMPVIKSGKTKPKKSPLPDYIAPLSHHQSLYSTQLPPDIPQRLFMTSLLKHTAIALAIIIPLAAYRAFATYPVTTNDYFSEPAAINEHDEVTLYNTPHPLGVPDYDADNNMAYNDMYATETDVDDNIGYDTDHNVDAEDTHHTDSSFNTNTNPKLQPANSLNEINDSHNFNAKNFSTTNTSSININANANSRTVNMNH